jgi:hypothetical protein
MFYDGKQESPSFIVHNIDITFQLLVLIRSYLRSRVFLSTLYRYFDRILRLIINANFQIIFNSLSSQLMLLNLCS